MDRNQFTQVPFAINYAQGYSGKDNSSTIVNIFVHKEEEGSKGSAILMNTEGLEYIGELPYRVLGLYEFHNYIYIATTDMLYKMQGSNVEEVGAVDLDRKVHFADNGIDLMIVGGKGYAYTPDTDTLKDMSTEDGWYPADMVTYMDGYFIFNRSGTGQFFISKLYSTEINPIDWATGESAPDDTVGVMAVNRQLWIVGEKSTEVWYDSGDPDFPFTRISGAVTDIGCKNNNTIAKNRDVLIFVGNDNKVYASNGYSLIPISTSAIEKKIKDIDYPLYAFTHIMNGHFFYTLHIGNDTTLVYDMLTNLWHERRSSFEATWNIDGAINLLNGKCVGVDDNKFYYMSLDYNTQSGDEVIREVITLPLNKSVNRVRVFEAYLDCEVAMTHENVKVSLQTSKDGGRNWSTESWAYLGDVGHHLQRVRWSHLGQFRDCIFKIRISGDTPIRVLGFYVRAY